MDISADWRLDGSQIVQVEVVTLVAEDGSVFELVATEDEVGPWTRVSGPCEAIEGDPVKEIAVSPNGNILARTANGKLVKVVRGQPCEVIEDVSGSGNVRIEFVPGKGFVVFARNNEVFVYNEDFSPIGYPVMMRASIWVPSRVSVPDNGGRMVLGSPGGGVEAPRPVAVTTPNFEGLDFEAAIAALVDIGLTPNARPGVEFNPDVPVGTVVSQSPGSGETVMNGSIIDLLIASAPALPELDIGKITSRIVGIEWSGDAILQQKDDVTGEWEDVPGIPEGLTDIGVDIDVEIALRIFRLRSR